MAIRILANGRLVLVLCVFAVSALWHWPASAQPTENTAGKPQSTVSENLDEEQRSLDKRKTKAEIAKLQVEWWTAGIAPVLSAASVLLLAITLITQRQTQIDIQEHQGKTQIDIQERQGKNQIDIQKRQEKLDFELKSAELI